MGIVSFIESYIGDLDDLLAYTTTPSVRIRDRHLGLLALVARLSVVGYIAFYQLAIRKSYRVLTPISGASILQLSSPTSNERWPSGGPYCAGASSFPESMIKNYVVDNATYSWARGLPMSRLECNRWDNYGFGKLNIDGGGVVSIPTLVEGVRTSFVIKLNSNITMFYLFFNYFLPHHADGFISLRKRPLTNRVPRVCPLTSQYRAFPYSCKEGTE